jgi:hypothetical protein
MSYEKEIQKGIELLKLCQQLQTQQDGIQRPDVGVVDKSKVLDQFAIDVNQSISLMSSLYQLIPMRTKLAELGMNLERQGKIKIAVGEDYADIALKYVLNV